jgi:hypothetical protein
VAKPRRGKPKARTAMKLKYRLNVEVYLGKRWEPGWFVVDVEGETVGVQTWGGDMALVPRDRIRPSRS